MATDTTESWPNVHSAPRLLASTASTYSTSIAASHAREAPTGPSTAPPARPSSASELNSFKSLSWTPDGTSVLTHSEDHGLRSFVLPPSLLEPSDTPLTLQPYTRIFPGTAVYSTAIYPLANLNEPSTFVFLAAARDQPIRLHSLLHPARLSSYNLINPMTEKYETPAALLMPRDAPNTFVAGTNSQIAFFDVHRNGEGPVAALRTVPTRRSAQTSTTMKGVVSALAVEEGGGVLAAGTWSRMVGLYDRGGRGDVVGCWELEKDGEEGGGIAQLTWGGEGGRYLYVAERRSEKVDVYDIRVSGRRVETLRGRRADTNQRMGMDVLSSGEIIGGGIDGRVRVWDVERGGEPVGTWKAHEDVVSCVGMHPAGIVMATCSGSRKVFGMSAQAGPGEGGESSGTDSESEGSISSGEGDDHWDSSLKIWEIVHKSTPTTEVEERPSTTWVEAGESREHPSSQSPNRE
ncbi:quinon protein alcohol dehydrogenase-like superfamily [Geopyxis carbonaria]|nr:quinon protein alcohol dehydrogenase-like superfamily [Geopyxis carbonaria]